MISTHLISDIERVLDEVIFLKNGIMTLHDTVDNIRETEGKSSTSFSGRYSHADKTAQI